MYGSTAGDVVLVTNERRVSESQSSGRRSVVRGAICAGLILAAVAVSRPRDGSSVSGAVGLSEVEPGVAPQSGRPSDHPAHRDPGAAQVTDDDASTLGNWSAASNMTSERDGHSTSECKIYKRTITSSNARADAHFLHAHVGLSLTGNFTYYNEHTSHCAEREILESLDGWGLHIFDSTVTAEGNISVSEWVDDWVGVKHNFGKKFSWDVWMHNSFTFYAPSLTTFLERWNDDGIPYLARTYSNALDGSTMYSLFVVLPHGGHVVEIVSDSVHASYASYFSDLEDAACPDVVDIGRTVRSMSSMWATMNGEHVNARGYPDLLIVKLSLPSSQPHALLNYIQEFGSESIAHNDTVVHGKHACSSSTMRFRKCTFATDDSCDDDGYNWHIDVASVDNPNAATGVYTVDDYEKYVSGVHLANLGCNHGWDRFLDWHLGIWCEDPAKLDKIGPKLCEADSGYHAHTASGRMGSLWTAGAGAMAIEFHGAFDYSFFNESDLTVLDYCSPTSEGICTSRDC